MNLLTKGSEGRFTIYFPETTNEIPPEFIITTPTNITFVSGTGTYNEELGTSMFEVYLVIPVRAPSSTVNSQWSITWYLGSVKKTMFFDVQDPDLTIDELYIKELSKFTIANRPYNARLIIPDQVSSFALDVYSGNSIVLVDKEVTSEDHRLGTQLSSSLGSTDLVIGEYSFVWKTDIQDYYQRILVSPISMLGVINKIRFTIDRVLKSIDEPQTYLDSDLYASILGGIDDINLVHPLTEYTVTDFPSLLYPFLHYAASIHALNSQYILESDLAFSYSGQSVSLDYDRTSVIESAISRFNEYLTENLPKAKKSMLRTSHGQVGLTMGTNGIGSMRIHRNVRTISNV